MISRKRLEPRASNHHQHSQYWTAGVKQSQNIFEEKALAVFQPDILIPAQYLSTYQRRFHLDPSGCSCWLSCKRDRLLSRMLGGELQTEGDSLPGRGTMAF